MVSWTIPSDSVCQHEMLYSQKADRGKDFSSEPAALSSNGGSEDKEKRRLK